MLQRLQPVRNITFTAHTGEFLAVFTILNFFLGNTIHTRIIATTFLYHVGKNCVSVAEKTAD